MDQRIIALLTASIRSERARLKAARHPQIVAAHMAAIRDFECRLTTLAAESERAVSG